MIGRAHIARVQQSIRCDLVGVADPFTTTDAGAVHFESLEQLLQEANPEGVVVATPNNQHLPAVRACAAAGVIPLIEKPLAGSLEDANEIVAVLRSKGLVSLVGHHRRHSAALRTARAIVRSGKLGRIVGVTGIAAFAKPTSYFDVAWRRVAGGGPVLINLVHEIDDLRFMLGNIAQVSALTSNAVRGFEVEDTAAVSLRFESGALGTFLLSDCAASPWSWEQSSGEDTTYHYYGEEACYRIVGTRGSLTVPDFNVFTAEGEPSWNEPLQVDKARPQPNDPLADQLDHFADVLQGKCAPVIDAADGLRTLAGAIAVLDSARSGRAIELSN